MGKININNIIYDSVVDGPGLRCTIFLQGCPHKCPGCHNKESWEFKTIKLYEINNLIKEIISKSATQKITLSGGEPFSQKTELLELTKSLKKKGFHICIYTGYLYEELLVNQTAKEILKLTDILIDGKFEEDKKDYTGIFKGSTNQRILYLKDGNVMIQED